MIELLAYVAYAVAAFVVAYWLLSRVPQRWVAGIAFAAMLALKFAEIFWMDLEPFGEASTWRGGGELPTWLLLLATANQYGAWGALGALLRHEPVPARRDADAAA